MIRKSHGLWGFIIIVIVSVYYCVVIVIINSLFPYLPTTTTTIKIATIIDVNIRIVFFFLVNNILTITNIVIIQLCLY